MKKIIKFRMVNGEYIFLYINSIDQWTIKNKIE